MCLVKLEKPYDPVPLGTSTKVVWGTKLIAMSHLDLVKPKFCPYTNSNTFSVGDGVSQGCILSLICDIQGQDLKAQLG